MADADFASALAALLSSRRAGMDFGLERIAACLAALDLEGAGAAAATTIQIAGTNGKGSSAQFLASVLLEAGISVGVFSSPHLRTICERFRIHGKAISRDDFVRAYGAVSREADTLTFFEQITAMAVWLFAEAKVEVAIYEVGLGGRLDSTTAIPSDIAVVTGIGLDHCEFLGESLSEIAIEKAGIFRAGKPALIGLSADPEIREQLLSLAEQAGAHPLMVGVAHQMQVPKLAMAGSHQKANAAIVAALVPLLVARGHQISSAHLLRGLAVARLAGRLEQIDDQLWVDGAHNGQAALALAESISSWSPCVLVVGLSRSKNAAEFLKPLLSKCSALIVTEACSDRAMAASEIAREARSQGLARVEVRASPLEALQRGREIAGSGRVLATGSLLLLGDILADHGPMDPIRVTDPAGRKFAPVR